ncbi:uncharacterized protein LOC110979978 [Acanthaster planci]|uniref:Uncharacterized protein LOC110979978 n=1 Tax=Acanthaster planci TaxID=133434 RepID=A0A8B7YF76_ACAPL|nr:uncharacterized protein LOC110979978 [Acanthaster planci]
MDDMNELLVDLDLSDVMLESPEASINFTPFINQDLGDEQPLSHEQWAGLLVHAHEQVNGPSVAVLDVQQTEIQVHRSLPLEDRYKEATEGEGKALAHQTPEEHKILQCLRCSKCHEMPKGNLVYITAKKVENARYQLEGQAHFCSEECALLGMHSDENVVKLCLLQEGCPKPCCVCLDEDCIWMPLTSCSRCGHYICAPCCVIYTRQQDWRCVVRCERTTRHTLMLPESLIGPKMKMKVHTFDDTVCVESESSDELPLELEGDIWPGFDEIPLTPPPSAEEQFRQHRQNELERENQMLEFHNSLTDLSYENTGISGPGNMNEDSTLEEFLGDREHETATPTNPADETSLMVEESHDSDDDSFEESQGEEEEDISVQMEGPGNKDRITAHDEGYDADDEGSCS